MLAEIDCRDDERPEGGRRQVDEALVVRLQRLRIGLVCAGRGRIEDDLDLVEVRHGDQALDALVRRRDATGGRTRQAIGVRVDADERGHLQDVGGVEHLDHQVGADVSRADDGNFGGHGFP